jgi:D-alanyl-D-alanine dipeptidase
MRDERWATAILPRGEIATAPAAPAGDLARLVGEYGTPVGLLTVYEADGRLYADGYRLRRMPLQPLGADRFVTAGNTAAGPSILEFSGDRAAPALAVDLNRIRLGRRDLGADLVRTIQAGMVADLPTLRATAMRAAPPVEPAPVSGDDLVDMARIDATVRLDIRYATADNFMGFPLYEQPGAYLQRPAAEALARVALSLEPRGYGLVIHDAYRPWFVTKMFWDATPEAAHLFLADPSEGSRHNRGCAVDLTLYELATGRIVQMTSRFDEMSRRSFADYPGGTGSERWHRDVLRQAMEPHGFNVYPQEWWHFDYHRWRDYGIGNVPVERLTTVAG